MFWDPSAEGLVHHWWYSHPHTCGSVCSLCFLCVWCVPELQINLCSDCFHCLIFILEYHGLTSKAWRLAVTINYLIGNLISNMSWDEYIIRGLLKYDARISLKKHNASFVTVLYLCNFLLQIHNDSLGCCSQRFPKLACCQGFVLYVLWYLSDLWLTYSPKDEKPVKNQEPTPKKNLSNLFGVLINVLIH